MAGDVYAYTGAHSAAYKQYNLAAETYNRLGRADKALAVHHKILELDSGMLDAATQTRLRLLALLVGAEDAIVSGQHEKAVAGFQEAIRQFPNHTITYQRLASLLVRMGRVDAFVPSVEKGVMKACEEGILAGYRVTDVKIDFYDGKMHPVDSKDIAFQIAGYFAFKEAFKEARPSLLEPIYLVEIRIPDDCMGKVMGDLSSRRGKIQGMDMEGGFQLIKATVPAKELYRYSSTLRSLTGGRGVHSEAFSHYEEMPREAEQKVIEESKRAKQAQQAE